MLSEFLETLKQGTPISFDLSLSVIAENYHYQTTAFSNGIGAQRIDNEAGCNEGSCKLFAFAALHDLNREQTLALFGDYYRGVLDNPDGNDHQNIRNFMQFGWQGIAFENQPLTAK